MEDRYLFKAKRIDNGEWVEGHLFDDGFENGRMFVGGLVIEEYHGTACDDWSITGIDFYEVDQSTICQCTGLKDKNGKLIWENDVVRVCWQDNEAQCEEIAQVTWDKFGYYPWLDEYHCDGCDLFNEVLDIEVIGNIFDNKELLESEEI